MVVEYLPTIKVLDVSSISIPLKVTVTRRNDGKLWWKYCNAIPQIQNDVSKINIAQSGTVDRLISYRFTQCLLNLLIYNNLAMSTPQKFIFSTDNDILVFIYFVDEDEIIYVPTLPNCEGNQTLKFTLYEDKYPIMKLQMNLMSAG